VDKENAEKAKIFGYSVIDPLSVIATHFSEVILSHASELLGRKEVNLLLEHMKKTDRFVVDDIVPSAVSVGELHKVLGNLLEEKIPIRDLSTILQTLGDFATKIKDPELLTEYVRQALKRTITHKFTEDGTLKVITLSEKVENAIMGSV
jgi:flagellar biosynthesis protein FlhA